jgi:hypothetical protein
MEENKRQPPTSEYLHKLAHDLLSHDKVMTRCVFGVDQRALSDSEEFDLLRAQKLPLIEWMGNLITIAGAFLYSKFNQWRSETVENLADKEQPNALYLKRLLSGVQSTDAYFDHASSGLRVLRVLDGLYDSFDMNFLVIKYLIINSQIEAGLNYNSKDDEQHGLSQLIGFPHEKSLRFTCNPEKKRFNVKGSNLAAAFNIISVCRNDPILKNNIETDQYKIDIIECAFEDVFKTLEFMKRVKLDIDGEGNVNFIETTADGREKHISSFGVAKVFETKKNKCSGVYKSGMNLPKNFIIGFYLLERIQYFFDPDNINAAVVFSYQAFDETDSVQVYFSENDGFVPDDCKFEITREKSAVECFKRISGYLPYTRSASSFFRGMINAHYRYHNMLAPSIVDAIDQDREAKIRILQEFVKNNEVAFKEALEYAFKTLNFAFGEVFPNNWKGTNKERGKIDKLCDCIKNDDFHFRYLIDWDTLVARILIYEGPSEIVRTILLHDKVYHETKDKEQIEKVCDQIIAGLEMRYIDNIFDACTVSQKQKDNFTFFKPSIDNFKKLFPGEYAAKMECKALAQSYIDTIVNELTKIDKKDSDTVSSKFAENSIQDTLEIIKTCKSEKNSINADKAFFQTIKAFLSFYAGIYKSCLSRMSYEFEKSSKILSPKEIEKWQNKIEEEFFIGVTEKAKELSEKFNMENAVEQALKELWKFADMPSDDERYYYVVLARAPINSEKLAKIYKINNNVIFSETNGGDVDFEQAIEDGTITEYLEKVVRFLAGDDLSDSKNKEKDCDKSNYTGYKEYAKRVVYPQIVTYAKRREDCDANDCLIMDHTGAFAGWHDGEVQILTEFKYKINHSYYVMPNLNRIETEWWVAPILISCYEFDEKVRKASADGDVK